MLLKFILCVILVCYCSCCLARRLSQFYANDSTINQIREVATATLENDSLKNIRSSDQNTIPPPKTPLEKPDIKPDIEKPNMKDILPYQDKLAMPSAYTFFEKPEKKTSFFNKPFAKYIIPSTLVTYGIIRHATGGFKNVDENLHEEMTEHFAKKRTFDDYLQYAPTAAIFGLDLATNLRAKHNLRDRAIVTATSYLIMTTAVQTTKNLTKVARPNNGSLNSFPSGHTATAFVGAHILYKEYRDESKWVGIAGYTAAATTGFMRMHNKRHWFSDVVTGAGVGILSAELGYMLLPAFHKLFGIKESKKQIAIVPAITPENIGIGGVFTF
ncbi:phosphatase PAP2 family protein [Dysgonomonas sp. 520]|uniref:phosphatase PAP2 family protein n=1 Tax=Dysgonomonas sp. 520 TaxID=2302931 RepID=UPI0013D1BA27|nr:phosphatase PAP2 family protein [Dysgonomonas sp. 520]